MSLSPRRLAPAASILIGLLLSACEPKPQAPAGLAEAFAADERGEWVRAREIYARLLEDCSDGDLAEALRLKVASLDWKMHDEGRSLEAFDGIAKRSPGLALVALGRAAELQEKAGASDQALETRRRTLELAMADPVLRAAAESLAKEALSGIERETQLGDLPAAAKERQDFFDRVPRRLLPSDLLERLEKVEELKAQADKLSQSTTDRLEAGPVHAAASVPDRVLEHFAKEVGERALSPDGKRVLVRRRDSKGDISVHAGRVGGSLSPVKGTKDAARPTWSRDGRGILFTRMNPKGGTRGVFYAALEGNGLPVELFRGGAGQIGLTAAWCPVADKVAFLYAGDLWVMDADGNNIHKVTAGLDLDRETPLGWSPDGTRLYFQPFRRDGAKAVKAGSVQFVTLGQTEEIPT